MFAEGGRRESGALIAEITMATLMVTAHCRNKTPVRPGMKAIGTKTEQHQGDGDDRRQDFGHGSFWSPAPG